MASKALVLLASFVLLFFCTARAWDSNTVVLYGDFVQEMYDYGGPLPVGTIVRGTGDYRVIGHLYAAEQTRVRYGRSYVAIGYIAVSEAKDDIVVVFRGTQNAAEWSADVSFMQLQFPYLDGTPSNARVHGGFLTLYNSQLGGRPSLRQQVVNQLTRVITSNRNKYSITFVGHSLGAALATLSSFDISNSELAASTKGVFAYGFASPMVGDINFKHLVDKQANLNILRISDIRDIFPYLPSNNYIHVGQDLTVDGCKFPYTVDINTMDSRAKTAEFHDLARYLHTVASLHQNNNINIKVSEADTREPLDFAMRRYRYYFNQPCRAN